MGTQSLGPLPTPPRWLGLALRARAPVNSELALTTWQSHVVPGRGVVPGPCTVIGEQGSLHTSRKEPAAAPGTAASDTGALLSEVAS